MDPLTEKPDVSYPLFFAGLDWQKLAAIAAIGALTYWVTRERPRRRR